MLVAGEAADTPEFLGVVHKVAQAVLGLRASNYMVAECEENSKAGGVELVIPDDRRYEAAKAVAF